MEFLKALFKDGEALTYDQLLEKATAAKVNAVNIADGSYVSRAKFDDKVNTLSQQVTDLQGQITQRNTDLADLQSKLSVAQTDAGKFTELQNNFSALQKKYDNDAKAWNAKNQKLAYEYAVKERANALSFTSAAAKRDFIREAISKDFKLDGDTLMGYEDFVTKYKAENPEALKAPKPDNSSPEGSPDGGAPRIVLPKTPQPEPDGSAFKFHFSGVRPRPNND